MAISEAADYGTQENFPGNTDSTDLEKTSKNGNHCGQHRLFNSIEGLLLGLLTGVAIAIANGCMTVAVMGGLSQFQVQIINGLTCFTVLSFVILFRKLQFIPESSKDKVGVVINGVLWAITGILLLYSLSRAPFGNVSSIFIGCQPVFTPILSFLILREMCRWIDVLGTILDVIGIVLITHPSFVFSRSEEKNSSQETFAYIMVTLSSLTMASTFVIGRFVGSRVHPVVTTIYPYVFLIIFNVVLMFAIDTPSWNGLHWLPWVASVASGIFGGLGELFRFRALQLESAISIVLLANTQILVAYIFQIAILEQGIQISEIIGACIILVASLLVTLVIWRRNFSKMKSEEEIELLASTSSRQ
ncbi:solute carrier family 35 member G1-like [Glandiceps talaboti]